MRIKKKLPVESDESVTTPVTTKERNAIVSVTEVEGDPALVEVRLGITKSIGKFEFVRVDVGITYPCTKGNQNATFDKCYAWVNRRMNKILDDVLDQ